MRPRSRVLWMLALLLLGILASGSARAANEYIQTSDIHGDEIVFMAEGDLWLASTSGGTPQRLTTHVGSEYFPAFSPDGRQIAFTGSYDGNSDVFIIPTTGGEPQRLTWHPGGDQVVGWWPDGSKVIFRSSRSDPNHTSHLFTVDLKGGDPVELPLGWAARIDVDPKTGMYAFDRSTREWATWKRYRGGTASNLWVGDPTKADYKQITNFAGMDLFPMWHDGLIYFLSDQGGTANIWSIKPDGSDRKRHTDFGKWDARWPAMGPDGRIVFTLAGDLHIFDPATDKTQKVDLNLPSDRKLTRTRYPDAEKNMTEFALAPDGERVAVTTRGEIFSVPVKDGVTLPITRGTGSRERGVSYGPKGEKILYITDEPHEDEFRMVDAWGRGEPTVVKKAGTKTWHHRPIMSPDGKWIAWSDNTFTLFVKPVDGGTPQKVDHSELFEIGNYSWSPDGRWLAYDKLLPNQYTSVYIYDTKENKTHELTGPNTTDYSPTWDPDGRYLYFISDRATNPLIGENDYIDVEFKNDMLYMVLLRKDVKDPMANLNGLPPDQDKGDKDKKDDKGKKEEKKKDDEDKDKIEPVKIDFDGLAERFVELPVDRGNYYDLAATSKNLFFVSRPRKGMAERGGFFSDPEPTDVLMSFSLKDKEADTFVDGIMAYDLNAKADKLAFMKRKGSLYVVDTGSAPKDLSKAKVDLSGLVVELDPREEWSQMYYEAWRQMRDFYWDPKMGGVDWEAKRDQYATLLPRLSNRSDLSDLIGQLYGEMATSHTYVWGGDSAVKLPHVSTGMLGADLAREGKAYKVTRIYRADDADRVRSPLLEPGVNVKEGDYILAVNRTPFDGMHSFYSSMEDLSDKSVQLTVNDKPSMDGAREVTVVPMGSESDLRYSDWVRHNREYVAKKTDGKIGYIHLPDMGSHGMIEFNTWFYPQLDKEGMVVDVRWNGGGSVSQIILDRLRRHVLSFDRNWGGGIWTYPDKVLNGPFVVLTNEFAGSDGDIFPQAVQLEKLAPVIGERSWGGVIGMNSLRPLVDGGVVTMSQTAWWDPRDGWSLENRGVIPDIEVQNMPQDLARGVDTQLDRGIAEVMKLHEEHPPAKPHFGPIPGRDRKDFQKELTN